MAQNLHATMVASFRADVNWFMKFDAQLNYPDKTGFQPDAGLGGSPMTAIARARLREREDEIANLQTVALFSGVGLLVSLLLLLSGWI